MVENYKVDLDMERRLIKLIIRLNWSLIFIGSFLGFILYEPMFARGILFGGLIVTVNFHLLDKTLKKVFIIDQLASPNIVLLKYYIRFIVSGLIILLLIQQKLVTPLGLFVGLSVVVVSIILATVIELKKLIFKEAV